MPIISTEVNMMIKNIDRNFNYISSPYSGRQLNKTDADTTSSGVAFSSSISKVSGASKIDKIEISQRTASSTQTIEKTKDKILADLNKDKDEQYIRNIKEQLNNRQYAVNPVEIAKIMLTNSNE